MEELKTRDREMSGNGAWSVILAGGEGERCRSFIEKWLGYHKRAYRLYLDRDAGEGHDLEDWLRAEREVLGEDT